MNNINLGTKIRELRIKKGITQEMLANALSVSPQAVSKWENDLTYPDMSMIPIIAGYFEISLDILFDFDIKAMKSKIQAVIDDAYQYFFNNTEKYIEIMKSALKEYPRNESLLTSLLEAYEYNLRNNGVKDNLDDIIVISETIISESNDFARICEVKDIQAAAYLEKGDYGKAKAILETLPENVLLKNDAIAFRMNGKDKLNAAIWSRCGHLQSLYIACLQEGDAHFGMNGYTDGLKAYKKGLAVLSAFLLTEEYETPAEQYLWDGMQTFHYIFYQRIAACYKELGDVEKCEENIERAYEIISSAWKDFEEKQEFYMNPFNQYLKDYGLDEYVK